MKKIFFVLIAYVLLLIPCHSQDIHFSQFTETPLLINPASTGVFDGFFRANLNYKNQWSAMGNPYRTMLASCDMPLLEKKKEKAHFGIGGYFFSDKAGDGHLGTASGNISASAIVPMNKENTLSAGFQFGLAQRSIASENFQYPNQYNGISYDPNLPSNEILSTNSFTYLDLSAGVNYRYYRKDDSKNITSFNAGAAYFHINQPAQKFYSGISDKLYGKFILNGQMRYDFPQTRYGIIASAIYMKQGSASEIDFGAMLRYKLTQGTKFTGFLTESAIAGGILYRINDAVIPQLFFEFSNFGVGLSYDVNISSLSQATHKAGGMEITLRYSMMKDALYKVM